MAPLSREILTETHKRAVVKFTFDGSSAPAAGSLTGSVYTSELSGYLPAVSSDRVNLDVGMVHWSIPAGGTAGLALAWGVSGSTNNVPFLYLNGNGSIEANKIGFMFRNTVTGQNRDNSIRVFNSGGFPSGGVATLILELAKTTGFGMTGTNWS